ncbi:hypothetical protein PENSPDRAFT_736725 [Peniophora sp. CONT]|nr:hypothetical protein PENSPDRAFT_736725 [Peniophora sp. CONT]
MLLLLFLPFFVLCVIRGVSADLIWLPKRAPATASSAQYGSLGQQNVASSWNSIDSASSWGTLGVASERRLVSPNGSPYTPEQQDQLANEGIKRYFAADSANNRYTSKSSCESCVDSSILAARHLPRTSSRSLRAKASEFSDVSHTQNYDYIPIVIGLAHVMARGGTASVALPVFPPSIKMGYPSWVTGGQSIFCVVLGTICPMGYIRIIRRHREAEKSRIK